MIFQHSGGGRFTSVTDRTDRIKQSSWYPIVKRCTCQEVGLRLDSPDSPSSVPRMRTASAFDSSNSHVALASHPRLVAGHTDCLNDLVVKTNLICHDGRAGSAGFPRLASDTNRQSYHYASWRFIRKGHHGPASRSASDHANRLQQWMKSGASGDSLAEGQIEQFIRAWHLRFASGHTTRLMVIK